jgi:hypothetical protein
MLSGNLNFLESSGPLQAYNWTALPFSHSRIISGRQLDNSKELFNILSVREIHSIKRYTF